MPREIAPAQLAERLRSGLPTLLVDVREDWEREIAKIAGDVHIPMAEVVQRGAEFRPPEGGLTIIYCHAGVRSLRRCPGVGQGTGTAAATRRTPDGRSRPPPSGGTP